MKELSIEEKARRYDEAIERAKDLYDFYSGNPAQAQKIIDIFPELIDEDEMIMKEILQSIKDNMIVIHKDKCIAWLEKQLKVKEAMRDVELKAKEFTKAHAGETSEEILAEMRGEGWADFYCRENCKGFQETGKCLADGECKAKREWYAEYWLKLLKDRVQPQPKQEWSNEDEKMIRALIAIYDEWATGHSCYPKEIKEIEEIKNWLKSIKFRHTWKPTEEQISALEYHLNNTWYESWQYAATKQLLKDLKQL